MGQIETTLTTQQLFGGGTSPAPIERERFMSTDGKGTLETEKLTEAVQSPGQVFERIRALFDGLGILGESLSLEHEGSRYRVTCDERAFMVYRVSENNGLRHHVPGWPVCLVNDHTVFEECCTPELGQDHCACGTSIDGWLDLVSNRFQGGCGR